MIHEAAYQRLGRTRRRRRRSRALVGDVHCLQGRASRARGRVRAAWRANCRRTSSPDGRRRRHRRARQGRDRRQPQGEPDRARDLHARAARMAPPERPPVLPPGERDRDVKRRSSMFRTRPRQLPHLASSAVHLRGGERSRRSSSVEIIDEDQRRGWRSCRVGHAERLAEFRVGHAGGHAQPKAERSRDKRPGSGGCTCSPRRAAGSARARLLPSTV